MKNRNFGDYYEHRTQQYFDHRLSNLCFEMVKTGVPFHEAWEQVILPVLLNGEYRSEDQLMEGMWNKAKGLLERSLPPDEGWEGVARRRQEREARPAGVGGATVSRRQPQQTTVPQQQAPAASPQVSNPKMEEAKTQLKKFLADFYSHMQQFVYNAEKQAYKNNNPFLFSVVKKFQDSVNNTIEKFGSRNIIAGRDPGFNTQRDQYMQGRSSMTNAMSQAGRLPAAGAPTSTPVAPASTVPGYRNEFGLGTPSATPASETPAERLRRLGYPT